MRIGDMFEKSIDRDIKGVIKVGQDDEQNIKQELEEYVITRELTKHFREFFENYKKGISGNTDKMGVWISGFFGSGKSHFLKMLSYLIANKEIDGQKAVDFFTDGKKITDSMMMADINLAADTSADVILFNIDSKSSADSKSNKDAIVEVFLKVFNEKLGYCATMPFMADLERKLVSDKVYDKFRADFKALNGLEWEKAREDFYFIQDDIIKALASVGVMSEDAAKNWCEKAGENYNISIEKFATLVKDYCEKKGNNHHVIFMVDEVGQYIGEDTKLMLNLQTVTEDLGTMCGGKAWVVVTSQQDIDSITKVKGSDFSKITGRFDTRLSLSSANVDEVIRKRILDKKEVAKQTLRLLYEKNESLLKNLVIFTADTAEKKMYADKDDFAEVYPFIPYQFNLLGQVLTSIREHGASGKHLSEGERSMLALFKESAVALMDKSEGALVPFNIFYNALHKFVDHTHSLVITKADENNNLSPDKFDVEVLKTLFMLKYVKEIKLNVDNITTLLVDDISADRIALKKRVEDSLKRLAKETLVQKNGEIYIFLTNEEQDINRSIAQEYVETGEVINKASEVIFEDVYTEKKYRYSARYNFPFNQLVDDRFYRNNQSNDVGIRVITPYSDEEYREDRLRMISSQENNIVIMLPNDSTFLDEITEIIKINKYITKNSANLAKSLDSIRRAKQEELNEKNSRVKIYIEDALREADIYVNGDKLNIANKDAVSRINEAMGKLVNARYNKLSYMETMPGLADIDSAIRITNQVSMDIADARLSNQHALDDMLEFINLNTIRHTRTSLKALQDKFEKAPYGFVEFDVQWLMATLFRQGNVAMSINSQNISLVDTDSNEILKYITRKEYAEKLLIEKREKATDRQIKAAKEVMQDLLGGAAASDEDDTLISNFRRRAQAKLKDIEKILLVEYRDEPRYPGKSIMTHAQDLLTSIVNKHNEPMEFFKLIDTKRDELLDIAEDIGPIMSFFGGEQKVIFAKACKYVKVFNDSKTYVVDREIIEIVAKMEQIIALAKPYSDIHRLPELNESFETRHLELIGNEANPIREDVKQDKGTMLDELNKKEFADKFRDRYVKLFEELLDKLDRSNNIAEVKNVRHESDALKVRLLNEIADYERKLAEELAKHTQVNEPDGVTTVDQVKKVLKTEKNVSIKQLTAGKMVTIEKEEDIDAFLQGLRAKIIGELDENTVIKLLM
ncbi:MAG TPA: BREX system P-loop protein BrxC [Clostridiales bacterium]|nr:MAG: ATPase [Clostridiales bacterium GWD2_32_19]HCC06813.1 BREX system P-loop protein BrxC [Clostridiales bacterium]